MGNWSASEIDHKMRINGCKGGPLPGSNFNYSAPLTEMVLIGNLALRAGGKIEWDGKNMRSTNSAIANEYVDKKYRNF